MRVKSKTRSKENTLSNAAFDIPWTGEVEYRFETKESS